MGKSKPNPRYELLSLRVTEKEKSEIWWISQQEKQSISDVLRGRIFGKEVAGYGK